MAQHESESNGLSDTRMAKILIENFSLHHKLFLKIQCSRNLESKVRSLNGFKLIYFRMQLFFSTATIARILKWPEANELKLNVVSTVSLDHTNDLKPYLKPLSDALSINNSSFILGLTSVGKRVFMQKYELEV